MSKLKTTAQTANYANLRKAGFGPSRAAHAAVRNASAPPIPAGPQPAHRRRRKSVPVPVILYSKSKRGR